MHHAPASFEILTICNAAAEETTALTYYISDQSPLLDFLRQWPDLLLERDLFLDLSESLEELGAVLGGIIRGTIQCWLANAGNPTAGVLLT